MTGDDELLSVTVTATEGGGSEGYYHYAPIVPPLVLYPGDFLGLVSDNVYYG